MPHKASHTSSHNDDRIMRAFGRHISRPVSLLLVLLCTALIVYYSRIQLAYRAYRRAIGQRISHSNNEVVPLNADKHFFLRRQGLESVDLHEFKSNYILEPKVYELTTKAPGNRSLKIISCFDCPLWFRDMNYTVTYHRDFKACPYSECYFDVDGEMQAKAALVLFFLKTYPESRPPRPRGQIWLNYVVEAPPYNLARRNKHYHLWKSAFNWTAGYSEDNDFFWPANFLGWRAKELLLTFDDYVQIAKQKTKTAALWSSHCNVQSYRDEYIREMRKYIDVDIYGNCGDGIHKCEGWMECLPILNTTYKFYLAFENSICKDYLTEKYFRSYQDRTFVLPVLRGGANYEHYFPSSTFINTNNFRNAKEVALYLKDLGNDHQKYASILQEKDKLTTLEYKTDWCDICKLLHTNKKPKIYQDINDFTFKEGLCWDRPDYI